MISIAISVLWFLIGLIIICGVIWLAIYVIETFIIAIPERIKQAVWLIVLILALIALLTALVGGGGSLRMPSFRSGIPGGAVAAVPGWPAFDLPRVLT